MDGCVLKDCIKVQEKKKKVVVLCSRPRQNVNFFFFSRCGHATTTKKCTIKRDALAKLLFCFFGLLVAVAVAVVVA